MPIPDMPDMPDKPDRLPAIQPVAAIVGNFSSKRPLRLLLTDTLFLFGFVPVQ